MKREYMILYNKELFNYTGNLVFVCSEIKEVMMECTCGSNGEDKYIYRTVLGKYLGK
jgi:hypothetical protein